MLTMRLQFNRSVRHCLVRRCILPPDVFVGEVWSTLPRTRRIRACETPEGHHQWGKEGKDFHQNLER